MTPAVLPGFAGWFAAVALSWTLLFTSWLPTPGGSAVSGWMFAGVLWTLLALTGRAWIRLSGPRAASASPSRLACHPALWIAVAALGMLACIGPALRMDFHFDDLFLCRGYTTAELAGTWTGSWDPNGAMRGAYRPLSAAWFAALHALFGESAPAHRLASAFLLAAGVRLWLAVQDHESDARVAWLALPLWLSSSMVSILAGWVVESFRAAHLLLVAGAAWAATQPRRGPFLLALPLFGLSMLLREESVPLAPWLAWLAWRRERSDAPSAPWMRRALMPAMLLAVPLVYLVMRHVFITASADRITLAGLFHLYGRVLDSLPFLGLPLLALIAWGLLTQPARRGETGLALAMSLLAALPGVGMNRVDVGIYVLLFLITAARPALSTLAALPEAHGRVAVSLLLAGMVDGAWCNAVRMEDLRPNSLSNLLRNHQVLRGFLHQAGAEVPSERFARFQAEERRLGFSGDDAMRGEVGQAWEAAGGERRFTHDGSTRTFRYAWDFLSSRPTLPAVYRLNARRWREARMKPGEG